MRPHLALAAALLLAPLPALAQTKSKAPAGPEVRYFTAIDGLMDNTADVVLRQLRQGKNVQSATLDVCYPMEPGSDRKDRFVVTLSAASGNVLTGTAQSQVEKKPVSVKLTQRAAEDTFDFKGQISVGASTYEVSSADNGDMSEQDYQELMPVDDGIVAAPKDFSSVSPEAISVKVRLESVAEFLKSLRGTNVEISPASIGVSCDNLRSGTTIVALSIDPQRAAAFVASVKSQPGVVSAGWTAGLIDIERAVRFAAADWRQGQRLDRDRVARTLADALAPVLGATFDQSRWSDTTGKLKLTFKRPSRVFPSVGLTELVEVTALVAPEQPGGGERLLLWVGNPNVRMQDESAGARLVFGDPQALEEEGDSRSDAGMTQAVARAFGAQQWDADASDWK